MPEANEEGGLASLVTELKDLQGQRGRSADKRHQIEHAFTYHAPKPGQQENYTQIRDKAKELALLINDLTPSSREQSLALTELETVVIKLARETHVL